MKDTLLGVLGAAMTLRAAYGDGGVNRIGRHVQRMGPGQGLSDFVINNPPETPPPALDLPEPSPVWLVGIGLFRCCLAKLSKEVGQESPSATGWASAPLGSTETRLWWRHWPNRGRM